MSSREKLKRDLRDSEQRKLIVEAQTRNGLPLQIRAMREQRGWTQTQLAEKVGTTQNAISRLESPRSGKPSITTLERLAEAYDVALIVKFATFSEFTDGLANMSPKSVAVPSYSEESEGDSSTEKLIVEDIGDGEYALTFNFQPQRFERLRPKKPASVTDIGRYKESLIAPESLEYPPVKDGTNG